MNAQPVSYRLSKTPGADLAPTWAAQLAPRLLAPPTRWGWQAAAPVQAPPPAPPVPAPRPVWVEPPRPDISALRAARSRAVSRLVWRVAFTVIALAAFTTYRVAIEQQVRSVDRSADGVYQIVLLVVAGLLVLSIGRALGGIRFAARNIRDFEQPYLAMRAAEQQRHAAALREWDEQVRSQAVAGMRAEHEAAVRASGPQWFPVAPAAQPTRIDVLGGDPRKHGWASLLVTFGSSALAAGQRITVIDCTGQDIGGGLLRVARAGGLRARGVEFGGKPSDVALLDGVARADIAACLAYALAGMKDGDPREERALATDVLVRVVTSLDGPVTFARLAAGVAVLRQGTGDDLLSAAELTRLAAHIGDIDQSEWTARRLRYLASQLRAVHDMAPGTTSGTPLWTNDPVSVIACAGGRDDRTDLLDRLLVQLARQAMGDSRLRGVLVVAGADGLGAEQLAVLADHARQAQVPLMLMIESPQGDLEKLAGTGGAVCLMKMYNHRDAGVAAEFIGKGYRFVVNQVTRQVGKTFTDGGGDSFAANSGQGGATKQRRSGTPGRGTSLSDSRGHTWTATRTWSTADNLNTSVGTSRVYEFSVDPQEILGMPETAFVLVDNTGPRRDVVFADCNPGISLLDRVSPTPIGAP